MKLWAKILLSLFITAAMLFGGFIVTIIVMFSNAGSFYTALLVICFVVIWLFIIMRVWGLFKPKTRYIALGAVAGLMLLSVVGFEINRAYVNSIDEVNEQGVNLTLYEPFREGTKAVPLNEESSLQMSENLLRLDGATALYPLYSAFAKAVYPEGDYPSELSKEDDYVVCTNTDGAYRRLINGEADIIFVAGPSQEQLQMAEDSGIELRLTPIGREAFVFFVNAINPVNDLSIGDIQKIYSGEAKNWCEFGGKDAAIKAFQRPQNSGSQGGFV